ncbi:MAG TPA: hypothetical protein VI685_13235 [Candidatus Angelobacter sp.]
MIKQFVPTPTAVFALLACRDASYDAGAMESIEQLRATYAAMTEDELAGVASDANDLTDTAQQVLRTVISSRGLNIELKIALSGPRLPEPDAHDEEDEDSLLVVVASPRSRNDAAKMQAVLNASGIRSCLGPENAENVESFHGTFDKGPALKVYSPFAGRASFLIEKLRNSIPPELENDVQDEADEEEHSDNAEHSDEDYAIRCPKCHSEEIVFDNRESAGHVVDLEAAREDSKYDWHCDACGYQWQDDGIED